jgi:DNA-binding MarR family transcriptional regulator
VDMSTVWIVDALSRGEPGSEVTIGELAEAIDVAHSTASRLADRAESSGTVVRRPSSRDARSVAIELTDQGRRLAHTAARFRASYLDRVTVEWTAGDKSRFAELLSRFAADVAATPRSDHQEGIRP